MPTTWTVVKYLDSESPSPLVPRSPSGFSTLSVFSLGLLVWRGMGSGISPRFGEGDMGELMLEGLEDTDRYDVPPGVGAFVVETCTNIGFVVVGSPVLPI